MISVIITTYKEPGTIARAIEAVAEQKLPDSEIIVVAPDMETLKEASKLRVKYKNLRLVQDAGKGKPAALNLAVSKAKGDILVLTDGDVYAGKLLKKLKIKDYVIIHPGFSFSTKTKYPSRFWPAERYAEVANYLIDKYKVKVLLDGSKEEKVFSEEIIRKTPKYKQNIFVINGIGIGELMALIAKAKLIIAPSTGVVHIAAAFSTSIVQLSGQESYYHWHPWTSEKNYKMIQHSEVCTECEKTYCRKKTIECMMAIKPEEVIKAAEHFLGKKK